MVNKIQLLRSTVFGHRPNIGAQPVGAPYVNFADKQIGVVDTSLTPQDMIGVPYYSINANYVAGTPVNYQGIFYIATVTMSAGAWNAANWSQVVKKTGDNMTGNLAIYDPGPNITLTATQQGSATFSLNKMGQQVVNYIYGYNNAALRWILALGDGAVESGNNTGSNFVIYGCNDAGNVATVPLQINRSSGTVTINGVTTDVNGNISNWGTPQAGLTVGTLTTNGGYNGWTGLNIQGYVTTSGVYLNQVLIANPNYGQLVLQAIHQPGVWAGFRWALPNLAMDLHMDGSMQIWGGASKPGGGPWTDSSDARIKNVKHSYGHGLAEIEQLNPVVYSYIGNDSKGPPTNHADLSQPMKEGEELIVPYQNSPHYQDASKGTEFIGLVAQDCEKIMPELVKLGIGHIDGEQVSDLRTLDTTPLIFALINAVKELSAQVRELQAKNDSSVTQ